GRAHVAADRARGARRSLRLRSRSGRRATRSQRARRAMSMRGLQGKVALVTGGGSGIGAGVVRRLADEGAKVVVVDTAGDRAQEVADALGGDALAVIADVSTEEGVDA